MDFRDFKDFSAQGGFLPTGQAGTLGGIDF